NLDKWNSLPQDVKAVLDDLARKHSIWTGNYVDYHGKESIEWSRKKYSVEFIELGKQEDRLWHEKVRPITEKWLKETSARGLPARKFLDDLYTLKAKYEKIPVKEIR
ncbi:MAG TPA: C4-dicarboxylate ABC transporter substrate-binding protein, partial [Thermodesulfobacteriaceae bacterium]|nr:C4-dicarboxylate ABC transporter substrate-binding protein [Thermodesulfobacteriaceae bacterium]